jgi:4-diphosphocytidyl-2-C-methyl-D-erythritol kinase
VTLRRVVDRVHARAPGKINIYLSVGAPGADGYHEVASVYQAVSLYEDVWASAADDFTIAVTGSVDVGGVPLDESNLAVRAARLLASEAGWTGGVHLDVHKNVPVAGGMGGGSADAAAALVACDALWGTGLSSHELRGLGARLGADVPFALMGGTAIGVGRGDRLTPALAPTRLDWVLVISDEGLSTPAVYRGLDERRAKRGIVLPPDYHPIVEPRLLEALRAGDVHRIGMLTRNDLGEPAILERIVLNDIIDLGGPDALGAFVSGSGPTVVFLAGNEADAIDLQVTLSAAGYRALHVHGPAPGTRIVP